MPLTIYIIEFRKKNYNFSIDRRIEGKLTGNLHQCAVIFFSVSVFSKINLPKKLTLEWEHF